MGNVLGSSIGGFIENVTSELADEWPKNIAKKFAFPGADVCVGVDIKMGNEEPVILEVNREIAEE